MASIESSQLVDLFKRLSTAIAAQTDITPEQIRSVMEHMGDATAEPGRVDFIEVEISGIPAIWCIPKHCAHDRVLLCAHGGGYISGSMYSHRKMYAHFAKKIGCRALIPNYGLAPENHHPGPVNDLSHVYQWLLNQGIKSEHIAIAGDSCGGSLAITILLLLRELGLPLPAAAMPLSPWIDLEHTAKSFESNKTKDALVSRDMAENMAALFLGENGDRRTPLANPLFADLKRLPAVYIQVGAFEVLLDDSHLLAQALRKAGVDVTLEVFPEMQHIFHLLAGTAPEANDAIDKYAKWVIPRLGL